MMHLVVCNSLKEGVVERGTQIAALKRNRNAQQQ